MTGLLLLELRRPIVPACAVVEPDPSDAEQNINAPLNPRESPAYYFFYLTAISISVSAFPGAPPFDATTVAVPEQVALPLVKVAELTVPV